jgi:D-3-phosphoglycerate dehydrogenase
MTASATDRASPLEMMTDDKYEVLVTDHDFADLDIERSVLDDLASVEALSTEPGTPIDVETAADTLSTVDALLNLRTPLDTSLIERLERCRIIARYGIGTDNIVTESAAARDIVVTNVPDYCVEEVSTHALAMILALQRELPVYDRSVAAGGWERDVAPPIHRLSERTLGVVGLGEIGRAVAEKAAALGPTVVASDPYVDSDTATEHGAELVEFETLLERADIVTVHAPLTDATRELFDAEAFTRLGPGAMFVNVARGGLAADDAILEALDSGDLDAAGLDVLSKEPPASDHPIRNHNRVLTTPHVAWYAEEANEDRRRRAAENVRAVLLGDTPPNPVTE